MFEGFRSFSDYVQEYDLERAEGLLLRHLNSVYKVLRQTVPDGVEDRRRARDGALPARHAPAGGLEPARRVGADARPRLSSPRRSAPSCGRRGPEEPPDVTRDPKAFTAAIRTRVFAFLRAWSIGTRRGGAGAPRLARRRGGPAVDRRAAAGGPRGPPRRARRHPPRPRSAQPAPHPRRARRRRHGLARAADARRHREGLNDWVAEFEVDLAASREAGEPVLQLVRDRQPRLEAMPPASCGSLLPRPPEW